MEKTEKKEFWTKKKIAWIVILLLVTSTLCGIPFFATRVSRANTPEGKKMQATKDPQPKLSNQVVGEKHPDTHTPATAKGDTKPNAPPVNDSTANNTTARQRVVDHANKSANPPDPISPINGNKGDVSMTISNCWWSTDSVVKCGGFIANAGRDGSAKAVHLEDSEFKTDVYGPDSGGPLYVNDTDGGFVIGSGYRGSTIGQGDRVGFVTGVKVHPNANTISLILKIRTGSSYDNYEFPPIMIDRH